MEGGGTSNNGGTTDTPASSTENAVRSNTDENTTQTLKNTAEAEPVFGSVSQIYGRSPNSKVEVVQTGESYTVTLPTKSGSTISLNTDDHQYADAEDYRIDSGHFAGKVISWRPLYKDDDNQEATAMAFGLSQ